MTGYIYLYISPSGKYYVGQTTRTIDERRRGGYADTYFGKAIKKYGIDKDLKPSK